MATSTLNGVMGDQPSLDPLSLPLYMCLYIHNPTTYVYYRIYVNTRCIQRERERERAGVQCTPPLTKRTALATTSSYQRDGDGHHNLSRDGHFSLFLSLSLSLALYAYIYIYIYICMDTWRLG